MKQDQVIYDDILKFAELKKFMEEQLEDYNMEPGIIAMDLVLFRDAIEHGEGRVWMLRAICRGRGFREGAGSL